jgi:UDP-glucuronate 4-epimerase
MRFLVTGGAGFIGSHVCEQLLGAGHELVVVDDLNPFYEPSLKQENLDALVQMGGNRFHFVNCDITDRKGLDKIFNRACFDQVIHLAARAGVRPSLEDPALYQRVNVEGTVNVLEAARLNGVKKIIIASSSSVYGLNSKLPFTESDPIFTPISPYAASKLACEALGHTYHHVYKLDVTMLRFFTVYGPRQRPDLAIHKFARLMHAGKAIPVFGDGATARDYTYIDDIVQGVLACTNRSFGFEIFNLGESQTVSLHRLIELLAHALQIEPIIDRRPIQPGDVPATYANIDKARKKLGYAPTTSIETGLEKFALWFFERNKALSPSSLNNSLAQKAQIQR